MIEDALGLTIITFLSKLFGFTREILLSCFFGTSDIVDSYLLAVAIPSILFGWIVSFSVSYTPIYIRERKKQNGNDDIYTNRLISFIFCIGFVASVALFFFAKLIVALCGAGFADETKATTVYFLRITIWIILLDSPCRILQARLYNQNEYIKSSLSSLVTSAFMALSVIGGYYIDVVVLPVGFVLGYFFQFLLLCRINRQYRYRFKIDFHLDKNVHTTFLESIPVFASMLTSEVNSFVDKIVASYLREGTIAALNYGFLIRDCLRLLFGTAVTTMAYPKMSEYAASGDEKSMSNLIEKSLSLVLILFIPLTIGAIYLSDELIRIIYLRGKFNETSLRMTQNAFSAYMLGVTATVLNDIFAKAFYSHQKGRVNFWLGFVSMGLNTLFDLMLASKFKELGLAFSTSLAAIIIVPFYMVSLRKEEINTRWSKLFGELMKVIFASMIMLISMIGIKNILSKGTNEIFLIRNLSLTTIVGVITYFIMVKILKVESIEIFAEYIKKLIQRKGGRG